MRLERETESIRKTWQLRKDTQTPEFTVLENVNYYLRKKPEHMLPAEGRGGIKALGRLGCQWHTRRREWRSEK